MRVREAWFSVKLASRKEAEISSRRLVPARWLGADGGPTGSGLRAATPRRRQDRRSVGPAQDECVLAASGTRAAGAPISIIFGNEEKFGIVSPFPAEFTGKAFTAKGLWPMGDEEVFEVRDDGHVFVPVYWLALPGILRPPETSEEPSHGNRRSLLGRVAAMPDRLRGMSSKLCFAVPGVVQVMVQNMPMASAPVRRNNILLFNRRTFCTLFAGAVLSAPPGLLLARNGGGRGGPNNGGNNNGVGNDNSNDPDNGVGNDDGGDHDNGVGNDDGDNNGVGNDDKGDDNGTADDASSMDGGRSKKREDVEWSQDKVLKERQLGRVISLTTALRIVNTKIHGRVIDVDLLVRSGTPQYRVKVRRTDGMIRTVRLDARTGKMISLLGF